MNASFENVLIVAAGAALGAILLGFLSPIIVAPIQKAIIGGNAQ